MRKLVSFMHISLDGFTTNSQGQMDWILADEEMFEIAGQQTLKSDTAIYGRGTYKIMEAITDPRPNLQPSLGVTHRTGG